MFDRILNKPQSKKNRDYTTQKLKFSITHFFSKCEQIRRKLRIWSHLLNKSLWKTSFFAQCEVKVLVYAV